MPPFSGLHDVRLVAITVELISCCRSRLSKLIAVASFSSVSDMRIDLLFLFCWLRTGKQASSGVVDSIQNRSLRIIPHLESSVKWQGLNGVVASSCTFDGSHRAIPRWFTPSPLAYATHLHSMGGGAMVSSTSSPLCISVRMGSFSVSLAIAPSCIAVFPP